MTTLEWDEVFDCAVAAWCRSSTSQEMLRMCFQSRTQRNEVSVGWTANELMAFATGIARLVASPTPPAEQQAQQEAQEPATVPYQKLTNEIDLILSDPDTELSIGAKRALLWMRTWVSVPLFTTPQPALDCHHRPPCDECAAIAAQGGK